MFGRQQGPEQLLMTFHHRNSTTWLLSELFCIIILHPSERDAHRGDCRKSQTSRKTRGVGAKEDMWTSNNNQQGFLLCGTSPLRPLYTFFPLYPHIESGRVAYFPYCLVMWEAPLDNSGKQKENTWSHYLQVARYYLLLYLTYT
jgi:hypothetical protein